MQYIKNTQTMSKVSKGRWTYSFNEGKKAEQKFVDLMSSRGNIVVKSSRSEDIHKHIDYYVNDIPIDVKGNRHLETIWLEITNVRAVSYTHLTLPTILLV